MNDAAHVRRIFDVDIFWKRASKGIMNGEMIREMGLRRVMLTVLFSVWLSVQFLVLAFSPSWGFVLPHEHITRGTLNETAWQDHLRQHHLGSIPSYALRCGMPRAFENNAVIASIPDSVGAVSIFALLTAQLHETALEIPQINAPRVSLRALPLSAFEMFYAPLDPPPNV